MRKIVTIALREYRAMVGTKAFLASIIMMPILMGGGILAMELLQNVGETKQRKIAISDQTGEFAETIQIKAKQRNDALAKLNGIGEGDASPGATREEYLIEIIEGEVTDELRVELSNQIKSQDLYAFVEIPATALEPSQSNYVSHGAFESDQTTEDDLENVDETQAVDEDDSGNIRFFSQNSSLSNARSWIAQVINETIKAKRLNDIGKKNNVPDLAILVQEASLPIQVVGMGLVEKSSDGKITTNKGKDTLTAIFLPMVVMMLMFMVIFMASQPMLESVLEEKSQRIAEVLLGSANPMQLMTGKLLGTVAGSLTVFVIYLAGAYVMCIYRGWTDKIPFELAPWFIVFQIMGVLFYAAIFMAIGASVSQLKEAQTMLLPVWMLLMSPMFVWIFIVRDPLGKMATGFSLFPPATPTTMMLRLATGQSIPWWQPMLGFILTAIATIFIVYLAARIFRVGILWQGKSPRIGEILKWAFTGG